MEALLYDFIILIIIVSAIGLFFGPLYKYYEKRAGGTLLSKLDQTSHEWVFDAYLDKIAQQWEVTQIKLAGQWDRLLQSFPVSYTIQFELDQVKKWLLDVTYVMSDTVRRFNGKFVKNPEIKILENARNDIQKSVAKLESFRNSNVAPHKFAEARRARFEALLTGFIFFLAVPFNFGFAILALTGGNLTNAAIYEYGIAIFVVLICEVVGGLVLFLAPSKIWKAVAIFMILVGCICETLLAIASGFLRDFLARTGIQLFEIVEGSRYVRGDLTLTGLIATGLFGFTLALFIALITHTFMEKSAIARKLKHQNKMSRHLDKMTGVLDAIEDRLEQIKSVTDNTITGIENARSQLENVQNDGTKYARKIEDQQNRLLDKVEELTNLDWNSRVNAPRSDNAKKMKWAPIIPIVLGIATLGSYFLYMALLSGMSRMNVTGSIFTALFLIVSPFIVGAIIFRPLVSESLDDDRLMRYHRDTSKFMWPYIILSVIFGFIFALNRSGGWFDGIGGSLLFSAFVGFQAFVFLLLGSRAEYFAETLNFCLLALLKLIGFLFSIFFLTLRFTAKWFKVVCIYAFEFVFMLLALPFRLWGLLIEEAKGLRR